MFESSSEKLTILIFDFSEFLSVNGASFGHKDLFPYERQSNSHERYNKTEIDPMVQIITALGKNLDDG